MASPSAVPGPARIWDLPPVEAITAVAERVVDADRQTISGTFYRAVLARHLQVPRPKPLYFEGSLKGARFTPCCGPAGLYLASDPATPMAEVRAVFFHDGKVIGTREHDPIVTICVRAHVRRVLDLAEPRTCEALDLSREDVTAEWEDEHMAYEKGLGPMPRTQVLAIIAHDTAVVGGIRYPSARTDFGVNLLIFPDRLDKSLGDIVEVVDTTGAYSQTLPD